MGIDAMRPDVSGIDALTMDGRIVRVRPVRPTDDAAIRDLYERASAESRYMRFFGGGAAIEGEVQRLVRPAGGDHVAMLVEQDAGVVAVASYERIDDNTAEFAVFVDDTRQGQGIGTLALEHLAAAARRDGIVGAVGRRAGRQPQDAAGQRRPGTGARARPQLRSSGCPGAGTSSARRRGPRRGGRARPHGGASLVASDAGTGVGGGRRRGPPARLDRSRGAPRPHRRRVHRSGVPGQPERHRNRRTEGVPVGRGDRRASGPGRRRGPGGRRPGRGGRLRRVRGAGRRGAHVGAGRGRW